MKLQKLFPFGILLLLSVATLSAQNNLPNPNDDACWSSIDSLHACQLQAYNEAMDQAQRCTSYPEFQCLPAAEQPDQKVVAKHVSRKASQSDTAPATSDALAVATDAGPQAGSSK